MDCVLCAFFFLFQKKNLPSKGSVRKSKLHVQYYALNKTGLSGVKKKDADFANRKNA